MEFYKVNSNMDPMEQIYLMADEIINQLSPDGAAMLAQAILNIIDDTNMVIAKGEPVYKKSSKLISRTSKMNEL
jgi:hypothetical protein